MSYSVMTKLLVGLQVHEPYFDTLPLPPLSPPSPLSHRLVASLPGYHLRLFNFRSIRTLNCSLLQLRLRVSAIAALLAAVEAMSWIMLALLPFHLKDNLPSTLSPLFRL